MSATGGMNLINTSLLLLTGTYILVPLLNENNKKPNENLELFLNLPNNSRPASWNWTLSRYCNQLGTHTISTMNLHENQPRMFAQPGISASVGT